MFYLKTRESKPPKSPVLVISLNDTFCLILLISVQLDCVQKLQKVLKINKLKKKALGIGYYYFIMNLKLSFINRNGIFLE